MFSALQSDSLRRAKHSLESFFSKRTLEANDWRDSSSREDNQPTTPTGRELRQDGTKNKLWQSVPEISWIVTFFLTLKEILLSENCKLRFILLSVQKKWENLVRESSLYWFNHWKLVKNWFNSALCFGSFGNQVNVSKLILDFCSALTIFKRNPALMYLAL